MFIHGTYVDTAAAQKSPVGSGPKGAVQRQMAIGALHGVNYLKNTTAVL